MNEAIIGFSAERLKCDFDRRSFEKGAYWLGKHGKLTCERRIHAPY